MAGAIGRPRQRLRHPRPRSHPDASPDLHGDGIGAHSHADPSATATPTPVPPTPTPTVDPNLNPLTGLAVTNTALLQRRPLEVVVNNMPVARPQYGLSKADVIFEYVMDGWSVTRFTAIYLGQDAERLARCAAPA